VSFIDDYSRKTWVYFLKSKDEVLEKFKEFKALAENLFERKIKIPRSYNGGEYTSNEFGRFFRDSSINRDLTTPYNRQQNGVAKRKNRTIMETVKTMIHNQDLPMHLWTEEERTTFYVQNILSHSALGFKTPEEMFNGKKPEVIHLKNLVVHCLYTFRKKGELRWILQERREYFLDTLRSLRPSEFTYQVTIILRSTEM
jgi:transposase InsO family protein